MTWPHQPVVLDFGIETTEQITNWKFWQLELAEAPYVYSRVCSKVCSNAFCMGMLKSDPQPWNILFTAQICVGINSGTYSGIDFFFTDKAEVVLKILVVARLPKLMLQQGLIIYYFIYSGGGPRRPPLDALWASSGAHSSAITFTLWVGFP